MNTRRDYVADLIKIAAIVTATPRWTTALLRAEGFELPRAWLTWWVATSAFLNVGMAVVEGLAFAYIFNAWRNQKDRTANRLLYLALFSAVMFVLVVTPSVAASVRGATINAILSTDWMLWVWAATVTMATIAIVGSVGYAQKQRVEGATSRLTTEVTTKSFPCWCGQTFDTFPRLSFHQRKHVREARETDNVVTAHLALKARYPAAAWEAAEGDTRPPAPNVAEVARMRANRRVWTGGTMDDNS